MADKIPDDIVQKIEKIWLQHRKSGKDWSAFKVIQALEIQLKNEEYINPKIPKKRKTQEIIKPLRDNYQAMSSEAKKQDSPWNMAAFKYFEIPAEALPFVLKVWQYARRDNEELTIRDVRWVSRLYALFPNDINTLKRVAKFYAEEELIDELASVSFWLDRSEGVKYLLREAGLLTAPDLISDENKILMGSNQPKTLSEAKRKHAETMAKSRGKLTGIQKEDKP
ncbi:MAG: hypothetical protein JRN22_00400 [Nitrososphaerota archaeon]|nr:hypothetical protein [Nitrososphaerota archaeon]